MQLRNIIPKSRIIPGAAFVWQTVRNNGRALGGALLRAVHLREGGLTKRWFSATFAYAKFVRRIQLRGGWPFVVVYLKACNVLLQQAASGHRVDNTRDLGCAISRTAGGLPRLIPVDMRKSIRSGDIWTVRLWLTFFQLYRVIEIPGKLKLSTITKRSSMKPPVVYEWVRFLVVFAPVFFVRIGRAQHAKAWTRYIGRNPLTRGAPSDLSLDLREYATYLIADVYPKLWKGLPLNLKPSFLNLTKSGPNSRKHPEGPPGPGGTTNSGSIFSDYQVLGSSSVKPFMSEWLKLVGDNYVDFFWKQLDMVFWWLKGPALEHPARKVPIPDDAPLPPGSSKFVPKNPGDIDPRQAKANRESKFIKFTSGRYTEENLCWSEGTPGWEKGNGYFYPLPGFSVQRGLGSLGFKLEPAGKIRVFAMVDSFTQIIMNPLHKALFGILKGIPQDGTFEQMAPANRLVRAGFQELWSLDLSAATDRFPLVLQQAVLALLIGPRLAELWASILVDRDYIVPQFIQQPAGKPKRVPKGTPLTVRYGAGQPMGALTSWAAFSLSHHFLVQWAAYKARNELSWFEDYALLGDDIVIANEKVAHSYMGLLGAIGVEYGLAKSLISRSGGFEFAKRTFSRGKDVSGFSLLAIGVAKADPGVLEDILCRTAVRSAKGALLLASRVLNYGFKARARLPAVLSTRTRLQGLAILLTRPTGVWGLPFGSWLCQKQIGTPSILNEDQMSSLQDSVWQRLLDAANKSLGKYTARLSGVFHDTSFLPETPRFDHDYYQSCWKGKVQSPLLAEFRKVIADVKKELAGLKDMTGSGISLDEIHVMIDSLREELKTLPTEMKVGARSRLDFGANKRSQAVRLWNAVRSIVNHRES